MDKNRSLEEVSRIIFQVREDELDGLGTEGSVSLRLAMAITWMPKSMMVSFP